MSQPLLFDDTPPVESPSELLRADGKKKRKTTRPQGYAALPGTGPGGETCGSCAHRVRIAYSKTYNKCALNRPNWTSGPGSDILVRSPACLKWQPIPDDEGAQ